MERERKDREAAEQRNQVLTKANKKAQRRISIGTAILIVTLLIAVGASKQVAYSSEYLTAARDLAQLAGQLEDEGSSFEAKELFSQAGQSVNVDDQIVKMNILHTGISYAHQKLKSKNLVEAKKYLEKVKFNSQDNSLENSQISVLYQKTLGNLLKEEGKNNEAIKSYQKAFDILDKQPISAFDKNIKILSKENVEAVHRELINLLTKTDKEVFKNQVIESLKKHYFDELGNYLNNQKWEEADRKTDQIMLFTTDRESQGYLDTESINKLSCSDIGKIDKLWREKSNQRFGFSVQKQIWLETGNRLRIREGEYTEEDEKAFLRFAARVGWYDEKEKNFRSYNAVIGMVVVDDSDSTMKYYSGERYRVTQGTRRSERERVTQGTRRSERESSTSTRRSERESSTQGGTLPMFNEYTGRDTTDVFSITYMVGGTLFSRCDL